MRLQLHLSQIYNSYDIAYLFFEEILNLIDQPSDPEIFRPFWDRHVRFWCRSCFMHYYRLKIIAWQQVANLKRLDDGFLDPK